MKREEKEMHGKKKRNRPLNVVNQLQLVGLICEIYA